MVAPIHPFISSPGKNWAGYSWCNVTGAGKRGAPTASNSSLYSSVYHWSLLQGCTVMGPKTVLRCDILFGVNQPQISELSNRKY